MTTSVLGSYKFTHGSKLKMWLGTGLGSLKLSIELHPRELFIKIVLGIRTENKNGTKYPWRDGAEKCSCTGTMLSIGLILEKGACILGCSLEPCLMLWSTVRHRPANQWDPTDLLAKRDFILPRANSESNCKRSVLIIRLASKQVLF